MERRAYEAALRAAVKVTLGTTMFGCGGIVMIEPNDEVEASDGGAPSVSSTGGEVASGGADVIAQPVCEQPEEPALGWKAFDAATFDCCVERIASLLPEEPVEDWPFEGTEAANRRGCCAQIVGENYEEIWANEPLQHFAPSEVVEACCINAHGNPGCTPWGPPAPVAMSLDELFFPAAHELAGNPRPGNQSRASGVHA